MENRTTEIERQWEFVRDLRRELAACADRLPQSNEWSATRSADPGLYSSGDNQALADLEHSWRELSQVEKLPPVLASRADTPEGISVGETPIQAMAVYVELGYYPPPELLLSVCATLQSYLVGGGSVTMEECFFGKPRPKGGNFAARTAARRDEGRWALEILMARQHGVPTDIDAAQELVDREQLSIDADSVLRRARKCWARAVPEKETDE